MDGRNNNKKLVIEGNAFYELDMQCVNQRRKKSKQQSPRSGSGRKNIRRSE